MPKEHGKRGGERGQGAESPPLADVERALREIEAAKRERSRTVSVTVELTCEEARDYARFLQRVGLDDY